MILSNSLNRFKINLDYYWNQCGYEQSKKAFGLLTLIFFLKLYVFVHNLILILILGVNHQRAFHKSNQSIIYVRSYVALMKTISWVESE